METQKEFRNILLGHQIKVYMDNKNLTYKTFNTERVMRWWLILKKCNSELIYKQGSKNITDDALSNLDIIDINNPIKSNISSLAEYFSSYVLHPLN